MHNDQDEENSEKDWQKSIDKKLDWRRFGIIGFYFITHASNDSAWPNVEPARWNLVNIGQIRDCTDERAYLEFTP
jgi:hypothetical protein